MLTKHQAEIYGEIEQQITGRAPMFFLSGPPGSGKSYILRTLQDNFEKTRQLPTMISGRAFDNLIFTATTHKAREAMVEQGCKDVETIFSVLGMRLQANVVNGEYKTKMVTTKATTTIHNAVIIIDEASFLTKSDFQAIIQNTQDCLLLFVGDLDQLLNIQGKNYLPPFDQMPKAELTEIVRRDASKQAITDAQEQLRLKVRELPSGKLHEQKDVLEKIDDRDIFEQQLKESFLKHKEDTVLIAYTNKKVEYWNSKISSWLGEGEPTVGDIVVSNGFAKSSDFVLRNNARVEILDVQHRGMCMYTQAFQVKTLKVRDVFTGEEGWVISPYDINELEAAKKQIKKDKDWPVYYRLQEEYADLRRPYAVTAFKSQGSTFRHVFIDAPDIYTCRNKDTLNRMLYVAVSRASQTVKIMV